MTLAITTEDVAVLGECCPSGRDSSLNLLVLVFVTDAVSLLQQVNALNFYVLDLSVVDIYWYVVFHHHDMTSPSSSTCSSSVGRSDRFAAPSDNMGRQGFGFSGRSL